MHPFARSRNGRELARAMKREEKRRAPRRVAKPADIPMIVRADYCLSPLDAIFTQLELRGELDCLPDGTPIFTAMDGHTYPIHGAVDGVAEFFDQWAIRNGEVLELAPLRQLAKRLEYGMPIGWMLLDDVKALMPALRRIAGRMRPDEASGLILGTQIKAELEAAQ